MKPAAIVLSGHPVWNLRTKTPNNEELTVPWHQDNAYLEPSALHALQPTAWVPLIDANVENGCMQASCWGLICGVQGEGRRVTLVCIVVTAMKNILETLHFFVTNFYYQTISSLTFDLCVYVCRWCQEATGVV